MQVKKFYADTIGEALRSVKEEFGPEAIILSSNEAKKSRSAQGRYVVVAAVRESALQEMKVTQKKLGKFGDTFSEKSAHRQKQIISSVVDNIKEKQKASGATRTKTRYADIAADEMIEEPLQSAARGDVYRASDAVARKKSSSAAQEEQGSL